MRVLTDWTQKTLFFLEMAAEALLIAVLADGFVCRIWWAGLAWLLQVLVVALDAFSEADEVFEEAFDPLQALSETIDLAAFN